MKPPLQSGRTPLHNAALEGRAAAVDALIAANADFQAIAQVSSGVERHDCKERTLQFKCQM
jgi:hypothetical protein